MTTRTDVEFTFEEAVRTMGVTPERLEKMIADGKVATVRVAGRTLIPRSSILEYFGGVSALLPRDKKKIAAAAAKTGAPAKAEEPPRTEEPAPAEA
jgi:hypothetical protein